MASRAGGGGGADVAVMPFFAQDGSVALLAFAACMPAAIWQARGEVRKQAQGDVGDAYVLPSPGLFMFVTNLDLDCAGWMSAVIKKCL